jgi:hypothetical protein
LIAHLRRLVEGVRPWVPDPIKRLCRPLLARYRLGQARRAIGTPAAAAGRRRYAATAKHVVFFSDVPRGREAKFGFALRANGWRVTLVHGKRPNYDVSKYFDDAVQYGDADDPVRIALGYSPVAYHVFSPSGDVASTRLINARIGPTVFDTTDILEMNYSGNADKVEAVRHAIVMQRHGVETADGYCARDLQFKWAERHLGYRLGGRVVFFPEYCWGTAQSVDPAARPQISCVQAGNFGIEKRGEGDWGYLPIAERLVDAGIRFDVYPNYTHFGRGEREFADIFSDYYDLARRSPLFHFHHPIPADQLAETLRAFDFGVSITWAEVSGAPLRSFNPDLILYCTSARIYDYLDAGLPVLLDKRYRLMHALLRRYGAAIPVDAAFMREIGARLQPLATAEMRARAVNAGRGLAVGRHIHRLERFYHRVAADVGCSVRR